MMWDREYVVVGTGITLEEEQEPSEGGAMRCMMDISHVIGLSTTGSLISMRGL